MPPGRCPRPRRHRRRRGRRRGRRGANGRGTALRSRPRTPPAPPHPGALVAARGRHRATIRTRSATRSIRIPAEVEVPGPQRPLPAYHVMKTLTALIVLSRRRARAGSRRRRRVPAAVQRAERQPARREAPVRAASRRGRAAPGLRHLDRTLRFALPPDAPPPTAAPSPPPARRGATLVERRETATGAVVRVDRVAGRWDLAAVSPDGRFIALSRRAGAATDLRLSSGHGQRLHRLRLPGDVEVEAVSKDGARLFLIEHVDDAAIASARSICAGPAADDPQAWRPRADDRLRLDRGRFARRALAAHPLRRHCAPVGVRPRARSRAREAALHRRAFPWAGRRRSSATR